MAAKLIVSSEAEQDIAEACGWYEKQRAGLSEEFVSCLDACIYAICRTPTMHAIYFDEVYRRGLVRRFPYAIFYEYEQENDRVIIHGVFHTSNDPNKWRQRLS